MTVCYYVTGHGYGHAVRSAQIINVLPPSIPVIVRSVVPRQFFKEELRREFSYAPAEFDCGCLQSDSVTVLPRATLDRYAEIAKTNEAHLADEVRFLRAQGVRAVVSDIPSFPLRAARAVGIPGFAVANFTWHDIYTPYAETDADHALLAQMANEYAQATMAFVTPLATPDVAAPFPRVTPVPLVARQGHSVRPQLEQVVGSSKRLALLYLGPWGMDLDWTALARITGWMFLAYDSPPVPVPNVHVLNRADWPFADTATSVDAVVSKAGYGTVTECIANDVPLIYVPRTSFTEYDALVSGMARWGGGVEITDAAFRAGKWQTSLDVSYTAPRDRAAYAVNGASVIAEALLSPAAKRLWSV